MRMLRVIAVFLFTLAGLDLPAQQLDSLTRQTLSVKLDEYLSAIETADIEVQKEETDFLIGTATDSLVRQYIAVKIYLHYFESPVMGSENVAIHILDKWFLDGGVKMYNDIDLLNARIYADFNRQSLIGMQAQPLTLADVYDSQVELYAAPGDRYSVLYFYDTGCAKCKLETMKLRNSLHEKSFPVDFNAVYVGDNRQAWKEYIDQHLMLKGVPVRHFWDPEVDSDYQRKYGVLQTPRMFLISPKGEILGRGLDAEALIKMLESITVESEMKYGDPEADALFDRLLGNSPGRGDIVSVAQMLEIAAADRGSGVLYKQLIGNYLYYLAPKTGEEYKEGLWQMLKDYVLSRPDIWSTEDDKLKVVGFAEILNDLLSKTAPGTPVPDIKVDAEYIRGERLSVKKQKLRKLRGKENIIIFHTEGCHICEGQIKAARELAASDPNVHVLLVNVDHIMADSAELSSRLFESFDLSVLPFIIVTDKSGNIVRRYVSLF